MQLSASLSFLFGTLASALFITSHIPMLVRAYKTKDLHSYSLAQIALSNLGNACYWIYVATLPVGPIWFMHSFYTLASALMLVWFVRYCTQRG